jgi:hypothetical protein
LECNTVWNEELNFRVDGLAGWGFGVAPMLTCSQASMETAI